VAEGKEGPWDYGLNFGISKGARIVKAEVHRKLALRCGVGFKPVTDRRSVTGGGRSGNLKLQI